MSGDLCCKPISPGGQITVTIYLIFRPRLKKSTISYKLHSNSNARIAKLTILFIYKFTLRRVHAHMHSQQKLLMVMKVVSI